MKTTAIALQKLSNLLIADVHRPAYNKTTVHWGWRCKACGAEAKGDKLVKHKTECPLMIIENQIKRANKIIGWMVPHIGNMAPPENGIFDLNEHCMENYVESPGDAVKGPSIRQHAAGARPTGVVRKK